MTGVQAREIVDRYAGRYRQFRIDVGKLSLNVCEWNPQGSRTVVLLHGINVQLHTWDPIAAILEDQFRMICVDLRGHGDSDWTQTGYGVRQMKRDVERVIEILSPEPVALVGHSLGARITIAIAGDSPTLVSHVILSDSGPEMTTKAALATKPPVEPRGFRDEAEVWAYYRERHPQWREEFIDLHARYQVRQNWAGKYVVKADPDLFWLTGSAGGRETPFLWDCWRRIQAPTLVLWGQHSPFLDIELSQRMKSALPRATEIIVKDCGHYIPREKPTDFVQAIRSFLDNGAQRLVAESRRD